MLMDLQQIQDEAQHEKRDRAVPRQRREHVARLGTEGRFRHPAAQGRTDATVGLRLLHEHDEHQKNRQQDQGKREEPDDNGHGKTPTTPLRSAFVNDAPAPLSPTFPAATSVPAVIR